MLFNNLQVEEIHSCSA